MNVNVHQKCLTEKNKLYLNHDLENYWSWNDAKAQKQGRSKMILK
jgi:hypothetical protein